MLKHKYNNKNNAIFMGSFNKRLVWGLCANLELILVSNYPCTVNHMMMC